MSGTGSGSSTIAGADREPQRKFQKGMLVITAGPDNGRSFEITKERTTIGRSVVCDLSLRDKSVSGTHCEIEATAKGFVLRDLNSTNGTMVMGLEVREVLLRNESQIELGQTKIRLQAINEMVEIEVSPREHFDDLVGKSLRMRQVFPVLEKVAPTNLTVLIHGETGTGKELVARAIHRTSPRHRGPLVVQDCSAIPTNLIESVLFGHERGSFTGAVDRHRGSFEQADGGTLFLDEIGELDLQLQPKLLRVLETREIQRVGGTRPIKVDVRIVAATNRDLRRMVNEGTFREDLYYRLSVVQLDLPPLRERSEDIPELVHKFLAEYARKYFPEEAREYIVSDQAIARLQSYHWPGNVRELKNTIERAISLAQTNKLDVQDLLPTSQKSAPTMMPGAMNAVGFVDRDVAFKIAKRQVLDAFEATYVKALLDKYDGNLTRAAKAAQITRFHLRELAKRFGLRDA